MTFLYKISFFSLMALALSCGIRMPKADPVASSPVELPRFPQNDQSAFALAAGPRAHNYTGNLLIWSPEVTPPLVQGVLDASIRTRKARAETLRLIQEKWIPAKSALQLAEGLYQEVDKTYLAALTAGFRAEAVRKEVTQPTAKKWFDERLTELIQESAFEEGWIASHEQEIRRNFAGYCDAKIWEFAVSRLATMPFMERPTPLGLCEDYYASANADTGKKPYFQNETLCGRAPEGQGKNYFACLWQDGLLLTPQFRYLEGNAEETCIRGGPAGSKAAAIRAWATGSPSLLERITQDDAVRSKLATAVMLAGSIPASTPDALGKLYPELKSCQLAFRRMDFDRTSRLEQASPGRLLAIGEAAGTATQPYPLDLIPRRIPADEEKDAADYGRLTRLVRMFGWRLPTDDGYSVSVSDILFNQPLGFDLSERDPSLALKHNKDAIIPDEAERADPAFRVFVAIKNQYVSAIYARRAAAMNAVMAQKKVVTTFDDALAARATLDQELSAAALRAVNAPHTLSFFHTFGLRLLRDGTHLTASFTLGRPITSCVDITSSSSCVGLAIGEQDIRDGHLQFDPEANRLVMRVPLGDLAALGMSTAPRSDADLARAAIDPLVSFNDLTDKDLAEKTLEIMMYGNRLGLLEFFTGDVFILDPATGEKLHLGSLNGDLFDETWRELLASQS